MAIQGHACREQRARGLKASASNRRQWLRRTFQALVAFAALTFTLIYVYGMFSPGRPASGDFIDFGGLEPGQALMGGWRGRPVWILRRSPAMLRALRAAAPPGDRTEGTGARSGIDRPMRSLDPEYGVYFAHTARPGVLIQFVIDRPRSLSAAIDWHGGFFDPGTGRAYDAAGRVYPADDGAEAPLEIPPHRHVARQMIKLGSW